MPIKILLIGSRGKMGLAINAIANDKDAEIVSACDVGDDPYEQILKCEAIIDFSFHDVTVKIAEMAVAQKLPLIIGTTGHTKEEKTAVLNILRGKIPVVWSGNYSVGVNMLNYLSHKAASILGAHFAPEVLELHHNEKKDAPSGTAERLVDILKDAYALKDEHVVHGRKGIVGARPSKQIGVHAIRGGDTVGDHTVYFCGEGERIELTHRATDRKIFAQGAIQAAKWAIDKNPGIYSMEDVLGLTE